MTIELNKLNYQFQYKPLLIGGKAMEYYGLRKAGADIDLVIPPPIMPHFAKSIPTTSKTYTAISASANLALKFGIRFAPLITNI